MLLSHACSVPPSHGPVAALDPCHNALPLPAGGTTTLLALHLHPDTASADRYPDSVRASSPQPSTSFRYNRWKKKKGGAKSAKQKERDYAIKTQKKEQTVTQVGRRPQCGLPLCRHPLPKGHEGRT